MKIHSLLEKKTNKTIFYINSQGNHNIYIDADDVDFPIIYINSQGNHNRSTIAKRKLELYLILIRKEITTQMMGLRTSS